MPGLPQIHESQSKPRHRAEALPFVLPITAYDNVSKLDKDLSAWLKSLSGWPYDLITFAGMVCSACGLTMATTEIPNGDFPVPQFFKSGVAGRQLMKWIGEIACRFCRANANGEIEFGWYADSGVTIQPTGDRYYFGGALTYEDYEVEFIDAVRLRLAESDSGALWPDSNADNPYVITGNPILMAAVTEDLLPYLEVIQNQLVALPAYKPCKVSLPASLDVQAGHMVQIVDKHGNQFTTCVMTKTQTGRRDTLECTGSARRDSSTAVNNQTPSQIAQQAVDAQTSGEVLNKLTDGGKIQGIYVQDNKWYINAEHVQVINLKAGSITAGKLSSVDGKTYFDLDNSAIVTNNITATGGTIGGWSLTGYKLYAGGTDSIGTVCVQAPTANNLYVFAAGGSSHDSYSDCPFRVTKAGALYASKGAIAGWDIDDNSIRYGSLGAAGSMWLCRTGTNSSPSSYSQSGIAGTDATKTGWCITVGNNFGVDSAGALFATGAHLTGTINASSGAIGEWQISDNGALYSNYWGHELKMNGKAIAITYASTPVNGVTEQITEEVLWKDLISVIKSHL